MVPCFLMSASADLGPIPRMFPFCWFVGFGVWGVLLDKWGCKAWGIGDSRSREPYPSQKRYAKDTRTSLYNESIWHMHARTRARTAVVAAAEDAEVDELLLREAQALHHLKGVID